MGFIPIFITLGGFVFLFMMLVNHNLNSKKKAYYNGLEALKGMVTDAYPTVSVGDKTDLKSLELHYREARNRAVSPKGDPGNDRINKQFAACKLAKFQYQQLKDTKPYYFVATLFGHADI